MTGPRIALALLVALSPAVHAPAPAQEPGPAEAEGSDRIGLADLAAYRAALSGRATADDARPSDPPVRVGFRELWEHGDAYRGRRVTVAGRIARSFRQGPVGNFPPLVESWLFSASGDPVCVVYPRDAAPGSGAAPPGPGRMVRFTGTFLKTVRYAAGDGERLAPLIVGDRPPDPRPAAEATPADTAVADAAARHVPGGDGEAPAAPGRRPRTAGELALALVLAAVAVLVIAGQHLRGARLAHRARRGRHPDDPDPHDPPLQFVDAPETRRAGPVDHAV